MTGVFTNGYQGICSHTKNTTVCIRVIYELLGMNQHSLGMGYVFCRMVKNFWQ
uniref:Uncharacterized protein n=1 Tax=Anguilla anguilla TaxID=7936 RepID=A0A0E9SF74_ANGAN